MTAANSLVAEDSVGESAKKIVDRFVSRFDESYRLLVYHAAIPLIVTPELLNYLRHQFLRGQVPWVAQVDLLLSDLFTPVASELYAMDSAVRGYLLGNIDVFFQERGFGEGHLQKVALILLSYIKYLARTHSFLQASELQAQQWAAMVCLEDGKQQVVRELEDAFAKCMSQTELARLTRITLELSSQLNQYPTLIQFAKSVRDWWVEGSDASESTERVREIARLGQSLGINSSIFLPQFEFETVTVNRRGEIIKRERHRAAYFTERIALVFDRGNPKMNESSSTAQQGESELAVPLEMVAIPGGKFMMGSPDGEGYDRETPQHEVTVPPFFMGKYPVTQAQWRAIAARTDLKVERDLDLNPARFKDREDSDERPVEQVSWYDAVEFCRRLSKLTGKEYRLPSEAEWEYACRAGTTTPFYFGETMTGELANYCARTTYAEEPKGQFREQTTPVGQFPPNAFGLYDMHGNVWEWCADSWHRNYEGAPRDGSAWVGEKNDSCSLLRGGSWYNDPHNCYSTYRDGYIVARDDIDVNFGFRVACSSGRAF
ncbi:formylglycine-generating enzyme family protein [Oxynema sp. CENA135]|uniref:formylglycine-generating enzyme family protein n=1 Tax=Oxynema sp. CENA135 TaxID=984206 RepID=UPI00190B55F2|nr:formylglycine-generating enzyme family protein [Oxynema sp. CENA135]MBK4729956.1 formylglycine-generating enzyme family protein [Oxynema sp. CENA135]